MADLRKNIARVLLTEEEIQSKVAEMAAQISEDYEDKQLLLVGILKGSMVFMADLMRRLSINAKIDFMSVSSYGSSTVSSGQVRIILDLKRPIENYDLLLVEDILDSGATLSYLKELLTARHRSPSALRRCSTSPSGANPTLRPITKGLEIPGRIRRRLRAGLRRGLPQSALHRRSEAGSLRVTPQEPCSHRKSGKKRSLGSGNGTRLLFAFCG